MKKIILSLLLVFAATVNADECYVATNGVATWGTNVDQCCSLVNGITHPCSLASANQYAQDGDNVNLRAGTYSTYINPQNSGSSFASRITFQSYLSESVIIDPTPNDYGVMINGQSYIVIDGLEVTDVDQLVVITNGSHRNEISNCTLHSSTSDANGGVNIVTAAVTAGLENTHNWVYDNIIYGAGTVMPFPSCNDQSNLFKVGATSTLAYGQPGSGDGASAYNTVEDNHMYHGGHHVIQVASPFNVIRNNFMHNDPFMDMDSECCPSTSCDDPTPYYYCCDPILGKAGNRVIMIQNYGGDDYPPQYDQDKAYTLIEGNRIGRAGLPSDDNGADGLTMGVSYMIARYNDIFNADSYGVYFRTSAGSGDYIKFYNNTVFKNGKDIVCREGCPAWNPKGIRIQSDANYNSLINNIVYDSFNADLIEGATCVGNVFTSNWWTTDGDPLFINIDLSDSMSETEPDLTLQIGSSAIDVGSHLTTAVGAGTSQNYIDVADPWFFQDGTWGSDLAKLDPDIIAIGTVDNIGYINSINYETGRIQLANWPSWSNGAYIWLYAKSDGEVVLIGSAPDIGAHEGGEAPIITPSGPNYFRPGGSNYLTN